MAGALVIVESPTKARTISGFLDRGVTVEASMGHVRDLPRSAAEIPEKLRDEPWARLGVNVDSEFEPIYIVPKERKDRIKKLRGLLEAADALYLATDEDREGESIAWHLTEVLSPKVPVRRMVFHEITEAAIRQAFDNPREIDHRLVDAQEARRILDRLYGYEVSPVLWRRVQRGLSAGRVQSVAVRIVVERERDRMRFRTASYWDLEGTFTAPGQPDLPFPATLIELDSARIATGKDFAESGALANPNAIRLDGAAATALTSELEAAAFTVRNIERKPYRRSPYPPFRTSTLQQEAARQLRFSSARTMSVAQRLYESGYITYMRTDSTTLSEAAVQAARSQIHQLYGAEFVPAKARVYTSKVKNAQEAHEAIRPAGERFRTHQEVAQQVAPDEARLYELIWKRTIASQMADAVGESVAVRLGATSSAGRDAEFAASGKVITFAGFLRAYVEGSDDPEAELDDQERRLPTLADRDPLEVVSLRPAEHETKPPPRFTEASLVRRLEELGVGRPSTYATIISTIEDRGYVWKKGGALVPSFTAFAVISLLEGHFEHLIDYAFTARMEDDLDRIAGGEESSVPWLSRFYFGAEGLRETVESGLAEIDVREINSIPIGTDELGNEMVVRVGRYGPYLQRGDDRASVPERLPPDELTVEKALELLAAPTGDKVLGTDPETGLTVLARSGRFGPYVQLGEVTEGSKTRPRTASLLRGQTPDELSLDQALSLLSLPRVVGTDPSTEEEITAQNGRYGPFLKRGEESRSLERPEQLFTITLKEALHLFSQPNKRRRGRRPAGAPLRELGSDPGSGKPITIRSGRYGPYVTDGEVNASLPQGDDPDSITPERAAELLAIRRARLASVGRKPAGRRGMQKKG